jgi:predicted double-glycine peptidase
MRARCAGQIRRIVRRDSFAHWQARSGWGAFIAAAAATVLASAHATGVGASHRDLRYEGIIGQSSDFSCGPAAVATLLSCFYGISVTESDVLAQAEQHEATVGREPGAGVSALSLKRVLVDSGIPVRGLKVTVNALVQHFKQQGLPLILHTTRPQKHFLVAVTAVGRHIVLADPSWGRRLLGVSELETQLGFDGVVLATMPPPDLAERAAAAQESFCLWARERLASLEVLRERMLWP